MTKVSALDRIVRRVASTNTMGRVIGVDVNKGKILTSSGWFSTIGKDIRYYEVTENDVVVECEGLLTRVKDTASKKAINIQIAYDINIIKGQEEKFILTVYRGDSVQEVIEEKIDTWIKEFSRNQFINDVNFIESFYSLKPTLQKFITKKAQEVLGVTIYPYLTLEGEENLDIYKPIPDNFFIRVKDFDEEISMKFDIGLEVIDGDDRIKAILNYNRLSNLKAVIQNEIQKYTARNVSLHKFCYELNTTVKQNIIEAIDPILAKEGRRTAYLSLNAEVNRLKIEETPLIKHDTKCEIKDSKEAIRVENRVIMSLFDLGKFRQQNVDNIQRWVYTRLDKIVQDIFFERTRIDLLDTLEDDRLIIKDKLAELAESIGFNVKHLAFLPDLDELDLLRGFDVESDIQKFKTQDSRVDIELELKIYAKAKKIKDIREYLNDGADKFKKRVQSVALKVVEKTTRELQPAEIYASSFEVKNGIDTKLKTAIADELKQAFQLEDITVNIIFHATKIAKRVHALQSQFPEFLFSVTPFVNGEKIEIKYKVAYKVERVDQYGWHSFQANDLKSASEEIRLINETLENYFKSKLDVIPSEVIQYKNYTTLKNIENVVIGEAQTIIIKKFGLVIKFDPLRRELSDIERRAIDKSKHLLKEGYESEIETAKLERTNLQKELTLLYKERNEILIGGDEDDLDEIDEKIKRTKAKMPKSFLDNYQEQHKQLEAGQTKEEKPFSFDVFNKGQKFIQEPTPKKDNNDE